MVVFEGQTGGLGGHRGRCDWANDSGAQFSFDEFGSVAFGASGFGENASVAVQLAREYGRYFCSTSTCGGFKNWISQLGTVTPKVVGGRVYVTLTDCATKAPLSDVRVCLGLMCQQTDARGEAYLGQFMYESYGLTAAANGYQDLIEVFVVSQPEHRISRCLTPIGVPIPGEGCDQWPVWLRPFCVWVAGLLQPIHKRLDAFYGAEVAPKLAWISEKFAVVEGEIQEVVGRAEEEAAAWRASLEGVKVEVHSWISESLAGLRGEIETTLIDPILEKLKGIWKDLGELWAAAEEIVSRAEEEAASWRKGVLDLEGRLKAWIETEIITIIWNALTAEKKEAA